MFCSIVNLLKDGLSFGELTMNLEFVWTIVAMALARPRGKQGWCMNLIRRLKIYRHRVCRREGRCI